MKVKKMRPNFMNILTSNGWKFCGIDTNHDNVEYYELTVLPEYEATIRAEVSDSWKSIIQTGYHGVLSLELSEYEIDMPYSLKDLDDMETGLMMAEDNLSLIGMVFAGNYDFHGRNRANKKRRNDALRRKYHMDEWEKEDSDYHEKKRRERLGVPEDYKG